MGVYLDLTTTQRVSPLEVTGEPESRGPQNSVVFVAFRAKAQGLFAIKLKIMLWFSHTMTHRRI